MHQSQEIRRAPWVALYAGGVLPGMAAAAAIALGSMLVHAVTGAALLGPMMVAVIAGIGIRMAWTPSAILQPGIAMAMRPVLRAGVMLLGLQVTVGHIAELGPVAVTIAALSLLATYLAVRVLGGILGVPRPLAMLLAAGTAVCGASAVLAANSVARGTQEDVAYAVASVTLFGTLAVLVLPVLAPMLELDPQSFGIWAGASVHEVGQVAAVSFQMGPEAGHAGTVTKLVRVALLAPLVIGMAFAARGASDGDGRAAFPWFVVGFLGLMLLNSGTNLPDAVLDVAGSAAVLFLSMGLAAMGLTTNLAGLRARGVAPLLLGVCGWVFIAAFSYGLLRAFG